MMIKLSMFCFLPILAVHLSAQDRSAIKDSEDILNQFRSPSRLCRRVLRFGECKRVVDLHGRYSSHDDWNTISNHHQLRSADCRIACGISPCRFLRGTLYRNDKCRFVWSTPRNNDSGLEVQPWCNDCDSHKSAKTKQYRHGKSI